MAQAILPCRFTKGEYPAGEFFKMNIIVPEAGIHKGDALTDANFKDYVLVYYKQSAIRFTLPRAWITEKQGVTVSDEYKALLALLRHATDPMYFIHGEGATDEVTTAKYWHLRTGSVDLVVPSPNFIALATKLQNNGSVVDAAFLWDESHQLTSPWRRRRQGRHRRRSGSHGPLLFLRTGFHLSFMISLCIGLYSTGYPHGFPQTVDIVLRLLESYPHNPQVYPHGVGNLWGCGLPKAPRGPSPPPLGGTSPIGRGKKQAARTAD